MEQAAIGPPIPYQRALRVVGAYLDRASAASVSIREMDDGLDVAFKPADGSDSASALRLGYDRLLIDEAKSRRRSDRIGDTDVHAGIRYEDVLRAVGYGLEEASAISMRIEEVTGDLVVSYRALSLDGGDAERTVVFTPDDQATLLQEARARRQERQELIEALQL